MNTARPTGGTKPAAAALGRPISAAAFPMPGRDDYSEPTPRPRRAQDLDTEIAMESTTTMTGQVFAAGVILESAANLADGRAAARLQHALDELDALVRDTRATAFGLITPPSAPSTH